jgi:hypothetical protein
VPEINGSALAEVSVKEVVELLEKLVAKCRKRFQRSVDVVSQFRENALGIIPGLDLHQIDISRVPFNLCADKTSRSASKNFSSFVITRADVTETSSDEKGESAIALPNGSARFLPAT